MSAIKITVITGYLAGLKNPYSADSLGRMPTNEEALKSIDFCNKNMKTLTFRGHWSQESVLKRAKKAGLTTGTFSHCVADEYNTDGIDYTFNTITGEVATMGPFEYETE